MAQDGADDSEKEFEPSQRRLDKAREDGDTVRSEDMQAAIGMAGLLLIGGAAGAWIVQTTGSAGMALLSRADTLHLGDQARSAPEIMSSLTRMVAPAGLLLVVPGLAVLVWLIATRGFVVAPSRLAFKASRISLLANAGQKFGRSGLVDFAKRGLKMLAIGAVLAWYLRDQAGGLLATVRMEPGQIALLMVRQMAGLILLILVLSTAFGLVDFLWQRFEFLRRHRMTRKELTDEMKDSEGDPHMKADRRRRAQEIATRRMLVEVPKADVIVVNPTHYAVALKWDRKKGRAPVCVAKGVDEIAHRIRALAQEAGVPIHSDPPTARALHAAMEIGQEVRPEHYAAVAAAIRFADALRKRARRSVLR